MSAWFFRGNYNNETTIEFFADSLRFALVIVAIAILSRRLRVPFVFNIFLIDGGVGSLGGYIVARRDFRL